jgi:HEAT repeat protein
MRRRALKEILRSSDGKVLASAIDRLLSEGHPNLAAQAVGKLAVIDQAEAVRGARKVLDSTSNFAARSDVAKILAGIPRSDSKALLDVAAQDESHYMRASTLRSLAATPDDLERLTLLVKDERSGVATGAAASLGELGNIAAPPLAAGLRDQRREVRYACAKALAEIGGEVAIAAIDEAIERERYPWKLSLMSQRRRARENAEGGNQA